MAQFRELNIKHTFRTELHNVHLGDHEGNTPLHSAVLEGNLAIMTSVIEYGAWIDASNDKGETALHLASQQHNFEAMKVLLQAGANPNDVDHLKCTPLHYFMKDYDQAHWKQMQNRQKVLDMVREMLECGALSNIRNLQGRTLLHLAIQSQQPDLVEMIMEDARQRDVDEDRLRARCLIIGFGVFAMVLTLVAKFSKPGGINLSFLKK